MTDMSDQFLTFMLDEEVFGIEIESVKEILELPRITSLPQTSEGMLGVINLRENAVAIFDLRTIFQLAPKYDSDDTSVIIMETDHEGVSNTMGMKVDSVREVVKIEHESMESIPASGGSADNRFIKGIARQGDAFVIILDSMKIMDAEAISLQDAG